MVRVTIEVPDAMLANVYMAVGRALLDAERHRKERGGDRGHSNGLGDAAGSQPDSGHVDEAGV
jgi:hypothetical protein